MSQDNNPFKTSINRREALQLTAGVGATVAAMAAMPALKANQTANPSIRKDRSMTPKAFVYTELQASIPFTDVPWQTINEAVKAQPGFMNKTWLSGVQTHAPGGFYAFDSIENAQKFVTGYFPNAAKTMGVAQTTRVFDALATEEASIDMHSVHFGGDNSKKPGAYVYTEVQVNVPFESAPWRDLNPILKAQKGLMSKTWLSGLHTHTLGGIYAFDTVENATSFAINYFPTETAVLNAAFYTRVFDASVTEDASRQMHSPYFA